MPEPLPSLEYIPAKMNWYYYERLERHLLDFANPDALTRLSVE